MGVPSGSTWYNPEASTTDDKSRYRRLSCTYTSPFALCRYRLRLDANARQFMCRILRAADFIPLGRSLIPQKVHTFCLPAAPYRPGVGRTSFLHAFYFVSCLGWCFVHPAPNHGKECATPSASSRYVFPLVFSFMYLGFAALLCWLPRPPSGFDPHDDSDYLTISNNDVYNNVNHGESVAAAWAERPRLPQHSCVSYCR